MKLSYLLAFAATVDLGSVLCSCRSSQQAPPSGAAATSTEQAQTSDQDKRGNFFYIKPNRAAVDSPFLLVLRLEPKEGCDPDNKDNHIEGPQHEVPVRMDEDPQIQYDPQHFTVPPCKNAFVRVTVKKKGTGLATLDAYADGYNNLNQGLDVGFDGKIKLTPTGPLSYDNPGTLNVEIVNQDDKPLSFDAPLSITLQSADAVVLAPGEQDNESHSVTLVLKPGARSSPQFQIKSQRRRGGTIHLSTSLALGEDVILSQENHSFDVAPTWWLPIVLAIFGALLYTLYSIYSDDKKGKVGPKVIATIVAGVIAWLFTGFDLLGLKLDTNSLRTYAITGFLFCFLGIDVLLSKRFPRTVHTPKVE